MGEGDSASGGGTSKGGAGAFNSMGMILEAAAQFCFRCSARREISAAICDAVFMTFLFKS
jgi:hypothetical protein